MVRLNILLLLAAVLCALSVVTSQHKARKLFQALESEQERSKQLEVEFGQLQLELSTWATSPRIEKIARDKLRMKTPEAAKIITISPADSSRRAGEADPVKHGRELSR
jgi:cell division protein FtsL